MSVAQLIQQLQKAKDKGAPITVGAMLPDFRHVYFADARIDCEEQDGEYIISVDMEDL